MFSKCLRVIILAFLLTVPFPFIVQVKPESMELSLIWKLKASSFEVGRPVIGDLNGDGCLDVIVGTWEGVVYAINGKNGSTLWSFKAAEAVYPSIPAVGDADGDGVPEVVFGSYDYNLYVLNGEDGSLLWKYHTGGEVAFSPNNC